MNAVWLDDKCLDTTDVKLPLKVLLCFLSLIHEASLLHSPVFVLYLQQIWIYPYVTPAPNFQIFTVSHHSKYQFLPVAELEHFRCGGEEGAERWEMRTAERKAKGQVINNKFSKNKNFLFLMKRTDYG